jgi:glucosyl-3-phosphoglycerate synthase
MPTPLLRTQHHRDFPPERLVAAKRGRRISVCLPARDEEATVGPIVASVRRELMEKTALVDEVLVVDDGSADATAAVARDAGARVVVAGDVLAGELPDRTGGKGAAMWKAVHEAKGEVLAFLDADVRDFGPRFVTGLLGPLLTDDGVGLVKAFYDRPLEGEPGRGGRVTELVARPLISLLFPHLATLIQPLAGECAGRRDVLEQVPFARGYGVELALLVDVAARFGMGAIAQVDIGTRIHRNRPLEELSPQALAILHTALSRAGVAVRPDPLLVRPGTDPSAVATGYCPPLVDIPAYRRRTA